MRSTFVALLVIFLLPSCYDVKSINVHYDACIALEQPITLSELESLFGKVHRVDGADRKISLHLFLPHEDYVMLHSSFIQAEVNSQNKVVGLKCAENKRLF